MPISSDQPLLGWVSGFGELSSQAASFGNPSFDYFTGAILTGIDYQGKNGALAGGALGYAYTHYYEDQDAGSGHVNYYFASFYANIPVHHFYFSPAVWGLFNQTDNQRHVFFPGFSETAQANIYSWQLVPHAFIVESDCGCGK